MQWQNICEEVLVILTCLSVYTFFAFIDEYNIIQIIAFNTVLYVVWKMVN